MNGTQLLPNGFCVTAAGGSEGFGQRLLRGLHCRAIISESSLRRRKRRQRGARRISHSLSSLAGQFQGKLRVPAITIRARGKSPCLGGEAAGPSGIAVA